MQAMRDDIERVLFTQEDLHKRIAEMGAQITKDYKDVDDLLVVSVLRGAAIFMGDLVRQIDRPLEMDYMVVSSYGNDSKSSGVINIKKDISSSIKGRHVLIAEDILDSGLTLHSLVENLSKRDPASIDIALLLNKKTPRKVHTDCRYVGFDVPDKFIVGFGMDYAEKYRNLPYIGILKPEVYES